jgi:outer membrane biosynthesis protein TonB
VRDRMNGLSGTDTMERWQGRVLRWTMGLSVLFHAGVILLGSSVSALFPPGAIPPVVTVELTDAPVATLPEEEPAPPSPPRPVQRTVVSPVRRDVPKPPAAPKPSQAEQWLKKLDAGLARVPEEAPVSRKEGKPGGIPVRQWETAAAPRPGDFAPAVAPENKALQRQISELEGRVRADGIPGVGSGEEVEISAMFGGSGTSGGEPIPPWIREMIRKRVREYLPELEALYSAAFRKDPAIRGKLFVRFRIDPSGKVVLAEPGGSSLRNDAFIETVVTKVRGWSFDPIDGHTVEVLYPFVFIAPS